MPSTSYRVADSLYLVRNTLNKKAPAKPVEVPTNHFAIIDCSGSMYHDLPKIREQLKRKLPKILKEKDTLTVIWFSGRKQFGTLLEAEPVSTLADLAEVERAIDRWLKPVGLTGFKEPMEEAAKVAERVTKANPGSVASLFFISDGCDNQWGRAEILQATEKAAGGFASCTYVEYGYYADRPLLTAMAERSGGNLIFSEDFDRYAPLFEAAMQKKLSGAPRVEVKIEGDAIEGFAYALADGDLLTYAVEGGVVHVPEDLRELVYLSPTAIGNEKHLGELAQEFADPNSEVSEGPEAIASAYAAVSLFAVRMKPKLVLPLLKALGDVRLINQFSTCFGKQAYSAFQDASQSAAFEKAERWTEGRDPNKVPRDDAFTVLQLMQLLAEDSDNRVLLDHEAFSYSRIGRGRKDASEELTPAELDEIQELTSKIASTKDAKEIKAHNARIAAITDSKKPALKFTAEPAPDGYPISTLTFNENRPNISFLVRKEGTVGIPADRLDESKMPSNVVASHIYRNYAVIKDGLVNIDRLPVRLSQKTYDALLANGCPDNVFEGAESEPGAGTTYILNLRALPVINQQMVKDVSAKDYFEKKYELTQLQAVSKVYNSFSKELLDEDKSMGFADKFGDEATAWLKENGVTEHGGYAPKTVQAEATDFYMGKELKINLKGLSSLPSLNDVRKQLAKDKLNAGGKLMAPTVKKVEAFLASDIYKDAADQEAVLKAWLEGQTKDAKSKTRQLIYEISQTTFALLVGQVWFSEFSSLDENELTIEVGDDTIACKAEMREIEVKI